MTDSSGLNLHGTLNGAPTLSQPGAINGDGDTSIRFDGLDDYGVVTTTFDPAATDFTAEGWFNISVLEDAQINVMMGQSGAAGRAWLGIQTNTNNKFGSNLGNTINFSDFKPTVNTWYHGAVTKSGSTVKMYINGVLVKTFTVNTESNSNNISVGVDGSLAANHFNGLLDEWAHYTRALSTEEIQARYVFGKGDLIRLEALSPISLVDGGNQITAMGGAPPYTYAIVSGPGSIDSDTGIYQNNGAYGAVTFRATDAGGNSADLTTYVLYTPFNAPGSRIWYTADSITNQISGTNVGQLFDISLNLNNGQGPAGDEPAWISSFAGFNNLPAVRFLGGERIDSSSTVGLGVFSVIIVGNFTVGGYIYSHGNCADGSFLNSVGTALCTMRGANQSQWTAAGLNLNDGTTRIITHTFGGLHSTNSLYVNGTMVSMTPGSTVDPGTGSVPRPFTIGSQNLGGGNYITGHIGEVMVFNTELTAAQRQGLECYLSFKFGVTVPHVCL